MPEELIAWTTLESLFILRDQPSRLSLLQLFEYMIGLQAGTRMETDALSLSP